MIVPDFLALPWYRIAATFLQSDKTIHSKATPLFFQTVRPAHLKPIDLDSCPEPKVQAQIVLRKIAPPSVNFLQLTDSACDTADSRADGAPI